MQKVDTGEPDSERPEGIEALSDDELDAAIDASEGPDAWRDYQEERFGSVEAKPEGDSGRWSEVKKGAVVTGAAVAGAAALLPVGQDAASDSYKAVAAVADVVEEGAGALADGLEKGSEQLESAPRDAVPTEPEGPDGADNSSELARKMAENAFNDPDIEPIDQDALERWVESKKL